VQIDKHVTMHTLRHSFATHLLEQKVDISDMSVVVAARDDIDLATSNFVNESVGVIDTTRPETRQVGLQWFRLTDALERCALERP
jgi:integrase